MSKKFTYIISSKDATPADAVGNCNIRLNNLPPYRTFSAVVKSFIINIGSIDYAPANSNIHYLYLTSNNFISSNEILSNNRIPNILALCDLNTGFNNNVGISFIMDNLNGVNVNFQMIDEEYNAIGTINVTTDTIWTLILELTPIE